MSILAPTAMCLRIIFTWMMLGLVSLLMTGWIGWIGASINPDFLARWVHAFILVRSATFTIVPIVAPPVQRLTRRLMVPNPIQPWKEDSPPGGRRITRLTAKKID